MRKLIFIITIMSILFWGSVGMANDWLKKQHDMQRLNEQQQVLGQQRHIDQLRNSNSPNWVINDRVRESRGFQQQNLNREWQRQSIENMNRNNTNYNNNKGYPNK